MAFREKMAWLSVAAHALVFGGYFFALTRSWDEQHAQGLSIGLMIAAVIAFVVIMVALTTAIALLAPRSAGAPADERERLIDLKAERSASYVLSAAVVCLIGALLMSWNGILVANLLLAAVVISELVKAGLQIGYYRGVL